LPPVGWVCGTPTARDLWLDGRMNITVTDAPGRERFEARTDDGEVAGFVTYQLTGNVIVYTHTEVEPQFEGKGVGSVLARAVLDDARGKGRTVVPVCPFLSEWLDGHPGLYDDIVAKTTRKVR
jgi:predicted GNAT family acetyltransferase